MSQEHSLWSHETVSLAGKIDNNNYKTLISSVKRTRLRQQLGQRLLTAVREGSPEVVFKLRPEAKKVVTERRGEECSGK